MERQRERDGRCVAKDRTLPRFPLVQHRQSTGRRRIARRSIQGVPILRQFPPERVQTPRTVAIEVGRGRGEYHVEEYGKGEGATGQDRNHEQTVRYHRYGRGQGVEGEPVGSADSRRGGRC